MASAPPPARSGGGIGFGDIAGPVLSLGFGLYDRWKQSQQQKRDAEYQNRQATAFNNWLKQYGLSQEEALRRFQAAGYNPFGAQTKTQTEQQRTSERYAESQRPTITPEYAALEQAFRGLLEQRLAQPSALPAGYAERAVAAIQASAAPGRAAIQNLAARTGRNAEQLGIGSPVERDVAGRIADLRANVPLLERQLRNEDIGMAQSGISQFGLGRDTSGTRSSLVDALMTLVSPPNYSEAFGLIAQPEPYAPYYGKVNREGMPEYGNEGWWRV